MFNESTDIDIASSIGEASRMVVVDEELARVEESPVIPETESYVPDWMQSWATRDVANKKAELADEELEVQTQKAELADDERKVQTQKAELSDKWAAIRANMLSEEWSKITQLENRCQELCRANTYMKDVIKKNEEAIETAHTVMKEFNTKYEETLELSKALLATNNKLLLTNKKYEVARATLKLFILLLLLWIYAPRLVT